MPAAASTPRVTLSSALRCVTAWVLGMALTGCAAYSGYGLPTGASAEAVRAAMGPPQRVWDDAGGAASWEYARGPEGRETFMVRLGADGRLLRIDQVLNEESFARVLPGMTRADVERLLGRPYGVVRNRLDEEVWSWRYVQVNVWPMCFYAFFAEDGRLTRTNTGMEDAPDDWPRRRGC